MTMPIWEQGCSRNPPVLRSTTAEGGQAGMPALQMSGDWKVARNGRQECLSYAHAFAFGVIDVIFPAK